MDPDGVAGTFLCKRRSRPAPPPSRVCTRLVCAPSFGPRGPDPNGTFPTGEGRRGKGARKEKEERGSRESRNGEESGGGEEAGASGVPRQVTHCEAKRWLKGSDWMGTGGEGSANTPVAETRSSCPNTPAAPPPAASVPLRIRPVSCPRSNGGRHWSIVPVAQPPWGLDQQEGWAPTLLLHQGAPRNHEKELPGLSQPQLRRGPCCGCGRGLGIPDLDKAPGPWWGRRIGERYLPWQHWEW